MARAPQQLTKGMAKDATRNVLSKQIRQCPVDQGTLKQGLALRTGRGSDGLPVLYSGSELPYTRRQHYENKTHPTFLIPK